MARNALLLCFQLLCVSVALGQVLWDTFPANEYEFSLRRDYLQQKEEEMEGNTINLSEDELVVDHYLEYMKQQHFTETKDTGFPPLRPIQEVMQVIKDSDVYRLLQPLPKGGNMHSHESHELSRGTLLDIIWESADFQYLYILPADHPSMPYHLNFFVNPPNAEWLRVQANPEYTKERILENIHLIGILSDTAKAYPTDSGLRWAEMNTLWDRASSILIANVNIKPLYLEALYESALSDGIQYLETRKQFRYNEALYELSTDPQYEPTNGKHYLDPTGEMDIQMTKDAVTAFIVANPDFIGHKRITYSTRFSDKSVINDDIQNALTLYVAHSDHLKGYDLVAEEDAGHSYVYFLENFLKLHNTDTKQSDLPLVLHTAETSFPKDLITSNFADDPVATAQNAYDAILLGATRVGHGLAYIKFPYLLQEIKARHIAVEVCPVSNQLLGLEADIRNHPAITYMKMGIPIILSADDPGSFGVDSVTVDWYEAFMAWGLTLKELKKFANNSIAYSMLSESEKSSALSKWTPAWNSYIATVREEACKADFYQDQPEFSRILPREGAVGGQTKIHVFGRHFESAICKSVTCYFNVTAGSAAQYVSSNHIICATPEGINTEQTLPLYLSFNKGLSFLPTHLSFTFKHPVTIIEPPTTPAATTTTDPTSGVGISSARFDVIALLLLLATRLS